MKSIPVISKRIMVKDLSSPPILKEVHKKVIPGPGDFIMYQGKLSQVVKISHSRLCLVVELNQKKIQLPLKVGYRIFMQEA